jgi:tRNA1(Val) A37 N6-methylase TrmN6
MFSMHSFRAVRFARFNAALNDMETRVTVLQGDLYHALQQIDLPSGITPVTEIENP